MDKVSFNDIDKLGEGNPIKALWKLFLYHLANNPKIVLSGLTGILFFILALIYPQYINLFAVSSGINKLLTFWEQTSS